MRSTFILLIQFSTFVRPEELSGEGQEDEVKQVKPRGFFVKFRNFGEEEKKKMIDMHNTARREVTPPASDMLELRWNKGMEALAATYVQVCEYRHSDPDFRRLKYNFSHIGENIWIVNIHDVALDTAIKGAVEAWVKEKQYFDYDTQVCSKACGHYTQTCWASSYALGCAVAECTSVVLSPELGSVRWPVATMLVCHYGPTGNINGRYLYRKGTPCTDCPVGFKCHDKLCGEPGIDIYSGNPTGKAHHETQSTFLLKLSFLVIAVNLT